MQLGSVRYDIAQENAVNPVLRCGAAPFLELDRDQSYRICQTTAASSALGPQARQCQFSSLSGTTISFLEG